jgi:dipeptidyl aminopeptidase/acylaminoacyl peptidase
LYKPENLDLYKKYPLIVDLYEKRSNQLNEFINPEFAGQRINIPSFVSNGYLVFVPDIYYEPKLWGRTLEGCIHAAMAKLKQYPFINFRKLGIHGHSFGGWEAYYLITHTAYFSAACAASGASNLISGYLQLDYQKGSSRYNRTETGVNGAPWGRGSTPWSDMKAYIDNSPIFDMKNLSTPLLIMHNKADGSVPFEQGLELYLGAFRCNANVTLLQYEGYGHYAPPEDYSERVKIFFDNHLKN